MYETVKIVKGYAITRMVGTHGFYHVIIERNEHCTKSVNFRTIKAATEYINTAL